jgi:hypothetical protein
VTGLERAKTYAAIFISAGEEWRKYVPVDATVKGDNVYLQGVHMEHSDGGWRLTENAESWIVRTKKP